MSGQMVVCNQADTCGHSIECCHGSKHPRDGFCDIKCEEEGCASSKCVPVKPPKPTRKRSAPLYGELLTERQRLTLENHNMRVCLDLIRNATLFGLIAWWFKQRKGRA